MNSGIVNLFPDFPYINSFMHNIEKIGPTYYLNILPCSHIKTQYAILRSRRQKKQISWFLQKLKTWKSIYFNCHIPFCLWKYPKNIEVTARKCLEKFCFMAEILDFVFKLFCTDFWLLSLRPLYLYPELWLENFNERAPI